MIEKKETSVLLSPRVEVSVVIATRNDASRVGLAIISVLQQSFVNFEIIVVNDASTDNTASVLNNYKNVDSRIRIITNPMQLGRAGARNAGMLIARGELIAVLDSDDIMFPKRLAQQVNFMRQNPAIGILGSGAVFELNSNYYIAQPPCEPLALRNLLLSGQNNAIINSSLLARKSIFLENGGYQFSPYSPTYNEDYYTFKCLVSKTDFSNIFEPLILVCTNGLTNPLVMKNKLREMHAYEWNTLKVDFSFRRLNRIIVRRLGLLIPDRIFMGLYLYRIRSMRPYQEVEDLRALKMQIEEQRRVIEKAGF